MSNLFNAECSSVQTHVKVMQDVIRRMAENSRACKLRGIAVVAASLILAAQVERPVYTCVSLGLAFVFLILDMYYIALERVFRCSYDSFVQKLAWGELTPSDLYVVKPTGSVPRTFLRSLWSTDIYPFYTALVITVLVARYLI